MARFSALVLVMLNFSEKRIKLVVHFTPLAGLKERKKARRKEYERKEVIGIA